MDDDQLVAYLHALDACHADAQIDWLVTSLDQGLGDLPLCLRCGDPTWRRDRRMPQALRDRIGICGYCADERSYSRTLADLLAGTPERSQRRQPRVRRISPQPPTYDRIVR